MSPEDTHKDTEKETDCETQTQNAPEAEKKAETIHAHKETPRVEMSVRLHKHGFIDGLSLKSKQANRPSHRCVRFAIL